MGSVQETAKTVLTPEEEDIQRRRSSGRNSNSSGPRQDPAVNVRRSASAPSTDSTDDEWLQQQLNDAKKSLKKEKERAKSQPVTDDWDDVDWGDSPATTRKSSSSSSGPSTSVIGRAQELAKEKVETGSVGSNAQEKTKKKAEVSDDDFLETGERDECRPCFYTFGTVPRKCTRSNIFIYKYTRIDHVCSMYKILYFF